MVLFITLSLLVGSGGLNRAAAANAPESWPYPNGDLANTRDAPGSTISLQNVSQLKPAWTFELKGKEAKNVGESGSLAAAPIVQNGVVYIQDLSSDVFALDLASGKLKWKYLLHKPEKSGPGPNGVAVVDAVVYGASPNSVFALNANTGKKIWVNKTLLKKGQGTFGIQPQVANGRVYLASQYGSGLHGGVLLALNASSGKLLWKFNTVLHASKGVQSLGLGAGGAWETPLVSGDGTVTFGTGNPYQTIGSAISNPAKLLYDDSDVNWYCQGVANDFKDFDMQASPISANVNGAPVVLGGGKMGYVYEMNAATGQLIWKTAVGKHNGHDNDSLNALEHKKLKLPLTYLPGSIGGILTNMALAGNTVYVVTNDFAFTYTSLSQVVGKPGKKFSGEIEALNLSTGKVEWDTKLNGLPLGAATVSNDLVFTTLVQGKLVALNRSTGAIVFQHKLANSTNSPIAIAGSTVLIPAAGPKYKGTHNHPELVAFTVPSK
jgi:outer membrane protein assembly factor BamB